MALMRQHNGMRPQDIVILFKLISRGAAVAAGPAPGGESSVARPPISGKTISEEVGISPAEVTHAMRRNRFAGLLIGEERQPQVAYRALYEFLLYGVKYVFPVKPGHLTRGVPTAHSAPPLHGIIQASEQYVWPHETGAVRGQAIEPLFRTVPDIVARDERLYQLLALTDALRVGRAREVKLARQELQALLFIKE